MKRINIFFVSLLFIATMFLVLDTDGAWEPSLGAGCVNGGSGMCIDSGASIVYPHSFWCEKIDIQGGCYY